MKDFNRFALQALQRSKNSYVNLSVGRLDYVICEKKSIFPVFFQNDVTVI